MFKSKVFRVFLVAAMVITMVLPAGFTSARDHQAKHISLLQDSKQILQSKIHADLSAAFSENEYLHVMVKFKEQVNSQTVAEAAVKKLSAQEATAYNQKMTARYAVVNALRETTANTQGPVLDYLHGEQVKGNVQEIDSYFIVNMVHAYTTEAVVRELALRPEIEKILPSGWIAMEKPILLDAKIQSGPGRQWNLENINAYAVWDTYGLDGTGIVVGMIDTGIHYEHEALLEKWRGYNAYGDYDSIYNWFDAVNDETMPYDIPEICHGTHVMGTVLGGHPETNNLIGIAPGAKWIAAKAFEADGGWDHDILSAAQYLLAPTDVDGNPNPSMAPDIINNSWGGGAGIDEWFRPMVQNWRAAQILPVFAAGNTSGGSSPSSVSAPANYPESVAVAAIDIDNLRAGFSNQGPGPYDDLKPDVSAPGVAIRSSVIGGYEASWSGTSMASPHVAGAAALLLQADTGLTVDQVEAILFDTAIPLTDSQYPESPNYGYGRGIINVFDAVATIESGFGTITGQALTAGEDAEPPVIQHIPVEGCFGGADLVLSAKITDDISVVGAEVWVQAADGSEWSVMLMDRVAGDHRDGEYTGVIPWMYVVEPGFTYKIVVKDWAGNIVETPEHYVEVLFGVEPGMNWDFESYPQGWYMDGDWQWGEPVVGPEPLSGTRLVGTNLQGNYSTNLESWLRSVPLDLRNASEASLMLQHWYDIEDYYDVGLVAITADYGENWEIVSEVTGYSQEWQNLFIDLNDYCGSENQVYVAFVFMSDYSVNYQGWYIDSVDFVGTDNEAPSAPVNIQAVSTGTGVVLTWEPAPEADVAGYAVYRSETSGGPYEKIDEIVATFYIDRNFIGGTEYFYVVTAVDFSSNESPYSNEASAIAPEIDLVFSSDFEADNGGLISGGENNSWEWGTPVSGPGNAFSGSKVWATNLAGAYASDSTCWLESPDINLSGYQSAVLEFAHWYELENYWDDAYVEVSSDGGVSWDEIAYFTGASTGWDIETISLDDYVGGSIKIRFALFSDSSVNYPGWYIDDVNVIASEAVSVIEDVPLAIRVPCKAPAAVYKLTRTIRTDQSEYKVYSSTQPGPQNGGIPVDAVVTVVESNRSVRTNPATGYYHMVHPALPEGETWTLRFEAYGFYTAEIPFSLERDEVKEISTLLDPIPRGNIDGTVVSSRTGEPIPDARIILLEDERVPWAITDEQGNFNLENVLEGSYTLRVSAEGFILAELPVNVIGGETINLVAELAPFIGYDDEIGYDDGTAENARAFYDGGNGWGARFTPDGMAQVAGASVYLWDTDWPTPGDNKLSVAVFDSLPSGEPGEMVIEPFVVEGIRGDWTYIDLSSFGFSTDRDFYIVYVQVGNYATCAGIGFDESPPFSGRTYEWYMGEFSPVTPDYGNVMIRANVKYLLASPTLTSPPDGTHINTDSVTVSGFVGQDSLIRLYVNGVEGSQMQVERGEFQAEIDLAEGENLITATAEIEVGATDPSEPLLIIKDTVAPELVIGTPADNLVTNKEVVTVEGVATDEYLATVLVNGSAVEFAEDGAFSTRVIVEEGDNVITVQAEDIAGNITVKTVTVIVDITDPAFFDLQPAEDMIVYCGQIVQISFRSDSIGGIATFAVILPGQQEVCSHRHPMLEVADGVYQGIWCVPADTIFTGAVIEFELIDAAGNLAAAVAPGRLSVPHAGCERLAGANRYETAVAVSQAGWETSEYVVLATGDNYADALAGAPLAYALDAPILLTKSEWLTQVTATEIQRLQATKIIILGGTGAVSQEAEDALIAMGLEVERINGANRFETAALIAARVAPAGSAQAALVNGLDFPDALSVAAYAARLGMPVLMTRPDVMPDATVQALEALGVTETIVIGGTSVVSDEVMAAAPGAIRICGSNRYATSVAIAEFFMPDTAQMYVATGLEFPDALSGAVLAAKNNSGVLLVGNTVHEDVIGYLTKNSVRRVVIFGGEGAVSSNLEDELSALLR
jgi:bacillopeptidase F